MEERPALSRPQWLARHRWLPFVLPFAVYLFTGALGAERPPAAASDAGRAEAVRADQSGGSAAEDVSPDRPAPSRGYAWAYAFQFAATLLAVLLVAPVYRRVPWRVSGWSIVFGVVGVVAWIVICRAELEARLLTALGLADWAGYAARPAFDPLTAFSGRPLELAAFLTVRFAGLALLVPVIEEFFVRGFLMRFFERAEWWTIPLGQVTWTAAVVATVYGVLAHPAEMIAAAVWFSLITLLYARTRNLWDCVVAHAITNGLLGIYILVSRDWTLW